MKDEVSPLPGKSVSLLNKLSFLTSSEYKTTTMPGDFEKLIEEHYQPAFLFALSLCRNPDDACDLTQQAFFAAQNKQHQLRDQTKAKQWLFTILHHLFLRTKRHEAVRRRYDAELEATGSPLISVDYAATIDAKSVLAALLTLEDHFRLPVSLFYFDQLSYKEIAEVLSVPIGTVMSRLARGKILLRQRLEQKRTGNMSNNLGNLGKPPAQNE
jgi:RNA polymerase sigma-70 factor, ECF subfamily